MTSPSGQRPFILDPLFCSIGTLSGVGPKYLKLYEKLLGGIKMVDLLFHNPAAVTERVHAPDIARGPLHQGRLRVLHMGEDGQGGGDEEGGEVTAYVTLVLVTVEAAE